MRVLATASRIFLESGYDAANLDEIAREAGVSKKTIYKHIGSKADLFVAAASHAMAKAPVGDLLAVLEEGEPRAALRALLLRIAALSLSEGGLRFYTLLTREAAIFPEPAAALEDLTSGFVGDLAPWLHEQKRRGWLRADLPSSAPDLLLQLLVAKPRRDFLLGRRKALDQAEQAELVDLVLDIFLDGAVVR